MLALHGTGDETKALVNVRPALYQLYHTHTPYCQFFLCVKHTLHLLSSAFFPYKVYFSGILLF